MIEQYDFAKRLRDLIRDTEHPDASIPAHKILALAEEMENEGEAIEMDMIIAYQRSQVEDLPLE